ncbi:unnamed protein product [Trichobilharzia szidati]|nr:unnamed protein product [Trichobilharzia szidati]
MRRSSLKMPFDPVNDSAAETTLSTKNLNRRVSFSQYIHVWNQDSEGESEICVKNRIISDISMEDDFETTTGNTRKDDNTVGGVTSIHDVSMEAVTYTSSCHIVDRLSTNSRSEDGQQQMVTMEIEEGGNDEEGSQVSMKLSPDCNPEDEMMIVENTLDIKTNDALPKCDASDMEVQNDGVSALPTTDVDDMSVVVSSDEIVCNLPEKHDTTTTTHSPQDKLSNITPVANRGDTETKQKKMHTPHVLSPLADAVLTDVVKPLSSRRITTVLEIPLVNLDLTPSLLNSKRRRFNNLQSTMLKTPQSSNPEKVTFISLINTPLRQADINERESRIGDRNGGVMLSLVKKVNPFRNLRDNEEYRPEKLISNSRRLHYQFHKQLAKCQLEPVVDVAAFEFSNIKSIFDFMRENSDSNWDLQGVNQTTFSLTDTTKYGLDEYLQLQQSQNLNLYDRLAVRRYIVERDNMERFHYWKLLNRERIGTVSISPQLNVVLKRISEMNTDQSLEFMAGLHQRLHNCFKLAKQECYQIIDENMAARNSELKFEIENLKVIHNTIEEKLKKREDKYNKLQKKIKDLQKLEKYAKELRQKLNETNQKIIDAKNRQTQLRQSNNQLLQEKESLEVKLKEYQEVKRANNNKRYNSRLLFNRSVGCTELFPIPITLPSSSPHDRNDCRLGGGKNYNINNNRNKYGNAIGDMRDFSFKEEIVNLLAPSRITLKSSKNHIYELTTLLGLVNFILTCQVCEIPPPPSPFHTFNHVGDEQNLLSLKHLKVTKLQVASPDDVDCPVECPPVESVARVCIDYLSTQGSDELRNLCIGLTLDQAIRQIQFIITPYMVLAADLRHLWLARYDVVFSVISLNDQLFSGMCVTPKNLRKLFEQTSRSTLRRSQILHSSRRTPFKQQQQQQRQQQYHQSLTSVIDNSITTGEVPKSLTIFQPITPPGPFNITVTMSRRRFRLRVCFTLFSLDFCTPDDQASVEFETLRGNLCCEKLNDHFHTCKPMSGHLSTIMSEIESFLSAQK